VQLHDAKGLRRETGNQKDASTSIILYLRYIYTIYERETEREGGREGGREMETWWSQQEWLSSPVVVLIATCVRLHAYLHRRTSSCTDATIRAIIHSFHTRVT